MRSARQVVARLGLPVALGMAGACGPAADGGTAGTPLPQPVAVPALRIAYGEDPLQFGELRLPAGPGPHPVAVVVHGGCWLNQYGLDLMDGLSDALAAAGVASWNVEYRRIGDPGGGYPNTFTDVGRAVDRLRELAAAHRLDLDRVVTVGHSAGGHLGLWVAARHRLPAGHPLRGASPLALHGAVALAGIPDLAESVEQGVCNALAIRLLHGPPARVPERYAAASPRALLPLAVPQTLIQGTLDRIVPPEASERYLAAARHAGEPEIDLVRVHGAGHFDVIEPTSPHWPQVQRAILSRFE